MGYVSEAAWVQHKVLHTRAFGNMMVSVAVDTRAVLDTRYWSMWSEVRSSLWKEQALPIPRDSGCGMAGCSQLRNEVGIL